MELLKSEKVNAINDDIIKGAFFNMAEPALILEDSGRIVEVNPACVSIFKITRHDLIGYSFFNMLPASETERKRVRLSFQAAKQSLSSLSLKIFLPAGENTGAWFLVKVQNFIDHYNIYNICTFTDISTLVIAEEENKAQENKVINLLDNANDLIQSVAQDGTIIYANKKWLETLGYTYEELSNLHITDVIREDQVPHCFTLLNMVKEGEKLEYVETVFVTKDRREIYVEGNINANFENGRFINSRGIFRDITRRKLVEETYSLLIQNMPIPVYIVKNGVFKFVNSAFRNFMGYSYNELIGTSALDIVHSEDRIRVYKLAVSALKSNKPASYEFRVIRKSGEVRWIQETVISIPYEGGRAVLSTAMDVTEQKLFEKAVEEAKIRFQTIFNSASDAIYIHDINDHMLEVNDAACKLLGYTRSELLKKSVDNIVSDRYKNVRQKEKLNEIEKGNFKVESENVTKDGRIIPVEVQVRQIEYEKRFVSLVVTRDITEQRLVEAIRLRNETRLESLVKITQYNPENQQHLLDFALNELVNLTESQCGYIYLRNEDTGLMTLNTWVGSQTEDCSLTNGPLPCPLKDIGNLELNVAEHTPCIFNTPQLPDIKQNGYPPGAYGINRHIIYQVIREGSVEAVVSVANKTTDYDQADAQQIIIMLDTVWNLIERRKANDDLKKNEQKYKALVENQSDLVIETDSAGIFSFVSPAYCKFAGLPEEDLLGVSVVSRVHPNDSEVVPAFLKSLSQSPYSGYHEHRTLTAGGWRWVGWVFNGALDIGGNLKAITAIGRDITESRRAKDELEQANQRLRGLDKLKDNFLSMVSHEMRTPLTSIISFVEILMSYEEDRPTQLEFLKIINDESKRLTRLINDFLDLSKIQAGHMKWKTERVSLEEAIITGVNSAKTLMEKNKLAFTLYIEPALPEVLSDRDRMIQVITNLLNNATKFTPEGGKIKLEAKSEKKGSPDEQVIVIISDTGMGIAPEYHQSIFENFGQVGDILKDRPKGTGLGLPICKIIIENYRGRIWLESVPGKGTTFYFNLPAAK